MKVTNFILSTTVSILIVSTSAFAQTGTSNMTGTVRDAQGAVVAGATVTATNEATGVKSTQTTT